LSTPKYEPYETVSRGATNVSYFSNQVIAYVRSMTGAASEKVPQTDQNVHDLTFTYRMTSDIVPFSDFSRDWLNLTNYSGPDLAWRSNYFIFARNLQTNLYDVRLLFRWPILPNGNTGEGRQPYRTMMGGYLMLTNEPGFSGLLPSPYRLHFFEPRTYVKAQ